MPAVVGYARMHSEARGVVMVGEAKPRHPTGPVKNLLAMGLASMTAERCTPLIGGLGLRMRTMAIAVDHKGNLKQPWPNAAPGATCGPYADFCGP